MVDMPYTQPNPIYLIYIYKKDLALNNLQWLICHETKSNQTNPEKSDRQLLCSFLIISPFILPNLFFKVPFFPFFKKKDPLKKHKKTNRLFLFLK